MPKNYDSIDKALNTESSIIDVESDIILDSKIVESSSNSKEIDIKKDYEYTRANLYSLIEKGQEAINGILELAVEGDSPRAYEVAGQLIKNIGDVSDKLLDLHKKVKEVEEDSQHKTTNNVTNNALFVRSTAELSKLLKKGFLNNNEET
jgi:hypothetical protein